MKTFIIIFTLFILGNTPVVHPPGISNEPKDYLFLTIGKKQVELFKRGKRLNNIPHDLCEELNNEHIGEMVDLKKEKWDVSIKFMLSCNPINEHKLSFSLYASGKNLLNGHVKITAIYKEDQETYSFLTENVFFKINRWNGFNGRSGLMRLLIYDKINNNVLTTSKPLKISKATP